MRLATRSRMASRIRQWFFLFPCGLLLLLGLKRFYSRYLDENLRITFFDVGQGDSALVRFPGGKTLLVDAGGGFKDWDWGSRELFPELARMGILRLDIAFLTHPDQDHAYGFTGIFKELSVGEFWFNSSFQKDASPKPVFTQLERLANERHIRLRGFDRMMELREGKAILRVLPLMGEKTNDRSLVLFLEFGTCRVLFTGDIEAAAEEELAREKLPPVTLLKVAHHGSKTSSTESFLRSESPRWAVISVGARNSYGHPDPGVLARLRRHHAQVFRTDFHGYVEYVFSPRGEARCESALGECGVSRCEGGR